MVDYGLIVRRMGLSGIANALAAFSGLILLPILTKNLSIEDYGTWALIAVTLTLVPQFATLGLPTAMVRFLAASTDKQHIQEVFYSIGCLLLVVSAAVAGVIGLFAPQIAGSLFHGDIATGLLIAPLILLACLDGFLLTYFKAFLQVKRYSILILAQAYLNVVFIAVFVFSNHGLQGAVTGMLIQELVLFVVMAYLIVAEIGVAIPKFAHTREHIAFGLPTVPEGLASWVVNSSDRYLIGLFLGAAAVGYYSPGYSLGSTISMLSAPMVMILPSVVSKYYDEHKIDDVSRVFEYSLRYYLGMAIPCVFALTVLSFPLLKLLSTQEIAVNGYLVTPLVATGTLFVGAYEVFVLILWLKKRTAFVSAAWTIGALVNFGLNLVLIPYLGIIGAALTTLLAFACTLALIAAFSFQHFTFNISISFIFKSVCASLVMTLVLLLWEPTGLLAVLVAILLSATVYLGTLFALRGFTIQEIKFFYTMFAAG
jgi:O-antigen/teichoic acid export membrane protein